MLLALLRSKDVSDTFLAASSCNLIADKMIVTTLQIGKLRLGDLNNLLRFTQHVWSAPRVWTWFTSTSVHSTRLNSASCAHCFGIPGMLCHTSQAVAEQCPNSAPSQPSFNNKVRHYLGMLWKFVRSPLPSSPSSPAHIIDHVCFLCMPAPTEDSWEDFLPSLHPSA